MTSFTDSGKLMEAVDKVATDKNDPDFKRWVEEVLQEDKHLRILASGKAGSGKSTLLNGILGHKHFVEGHSLKPETKAVDEHEFDIGSLKITAWDSPGLQDGTIHEEAYLKDIAEKTTAAGGIDLLLYCIRMDETRSDLHIHSSAMQKLTQSLKENIWENALITLTFGNMYKDQLETTHEVEGDELASLFCDKVKEWREVVSTELLKMGVKQEIIDKIHFQPAGHYRRLHLPGNQYWASLLWAHAFAALKDSSKSALFTLNADRMKIEDDETQKSNEDKRTLEKQEIHVSKTFLEIIDQNKALTGVVGTAASTATGAAAGAGIGAITAYSTASLVLAGTGVGLVLGIGGAGCLILYAMYKKGKQKNKKD